jgi:hypothetical protein
MAGNKSNYLAKKVLDHVLGKTTYTAPSTIYFGLWTATLGDSSTGTTAGEPTDLYDSGTGLGYRRVSKTNNTSFWPNALGSDVATKSNNDALTWSTAAADWGTITHFAILDDGPTAGAAANVLYWGQLTSPKIISTGDTASFSSTALVVTED